jgi:hypothetical protein
MIVLVTNRQDSLVYLSLNREHVCIACGVHELVCVA